jgi:hypothetical protein
MEPTEQTEQQALHLEVAIAVVAESFKGSCWSVLSVVAHVDILGTEACHELQRQIE